MGMCMRAHVQSGREEWMKRRLERGEDGSRPGRGVVLVAVALLIFYAPSWSLCQQSSWRKSEETQWGREGSPGKRANVPLSKGYIQDCSSSTGCSTYSGGIAALGWWWLSCKSFIWLIQEKKARISRDNNIFSINIWHCSTKQQFLLTPFITYKKIASSFINKFLIMTNYNQ